MAAMTTCAKLIQSTQSVAIGRVGWVGAGQEEAPAYGSGVRDKDMPHSHTPPSVAAAQWRQTTSRYIQCDARRPGKMNKIKSKALENICKIEKKTNK